mgnify:FL=1
MIEQREFGAPFGSIWNPAKADPTGYVAPDRSLPGLPADHPASRPAVTVFGTIRNERKALARSLSVWLRQVRPDWLTVEFLILDDGSDDGVETTIEGLLDAGAPIRFTRWRKPGDEGDRSCTVVFNAALRLIDSPLVVAQWFDRVPGSLGHLAALVAPHRKRAGIATSAISRHVGSSSSVTDMPPAQLDALLGLVDWRERPEQLDLVAGPIGGHCVPGQATESSGLCLPLAELVALGGWDERYGALRHGYPNVDLWRRVLGSGLTAVFPDAPVANNYHLSHPAGRREGKDTSLLADVTLARNPAGWSVPGPIFDSGPTKPGGKMDAKRVAAILAAECARSG